MNKQALLSAAAGSVLIAGLASCTKEKTITPDVYNPDAPKIVSANGEVRASAGTFDLSDTLDVSRAATTAVEVHGTCARAGVSTPLDKTFVGETQISMLRIMPEFYFVTDFHATPVVCNFVFRLKNALGSAHIFEQAGLTLKDNMPAKVQLSYDNGPPPVLLKIGPMLQNLRIRFRNQWPAEVTLACETFTVPALHFDDVKNFDFFDLNARQKRAADLAWPEENCRIVILQDGKISALSPLFKFDVFKPLQMTEQPQSISPHDAHTFVGGAACNSPILASQFTLHNPETSPRIVRLPQLTYGVDQATYSYPETPQAHYKLSYIEVAADDLKSLISSDANSRTWRIEPGASLNFSIYLHIDRRVCDAIKSAPIDGNLFRFFEALPFQEIGHNGQVVEEIRFPIQQCFLAMVDYTFVGSELSQLKSRLYPPCQ